jgi:uncharacterized membrane protein YeaQ/YmgE (transglycosylase-associated protein family)
MDAGLILFILLPVVGGFTGWAASRVMTPVAEQGIILDMILGIAGAFFGGWIPTVVVHATFVEALVFGFAFAALVLGVLRFVRKPLNATTAS